MWCTPKQEYPNTLITYIAVVLVRVGHRSAAWLFFYGNCIFDIIVTQTKDNVLDWKKQQLGRLVSGFVTCIVCALWSFLLRVVCGAQLRVVHIASCEELSGMNRSERWCVIQLIVLYILAWFTHSIMVNIFLQAEMFWYHFHINGWIGKASKVYNTV